MPCFCITTGPFGVLPYVGTVHTLVFSLVWKAYPVPFTPLAPYASPHPTPTPYSISQPPYVPLFLSISSTDNTCHFVWVVAPYTSITSLLLLTDTIQHGLPSPIFVPLTIFNYTHQYNLVCSFVSLVCAVFSLYVQHSHYTACCSVSRHFCLPLIPLTLTPLCILPFS